VEECTDAEAAWSPTGVGLTLAWGVLALSALWGTVALPRLVCDVRAVCGLWPAL
jgi:hypothetical protein